ncbi:hypothetical protein [Agromyces seonyuensis]|uniref:Uncharacterized protein n=1 Tax=Agromyces seonyuensis TaxID=2662446 RepID=A0A6I4P1J2_9MICO|nr:hypothetical protein [Agromyces seonyuensis]MWB98605.1 hypothetical protein [Agromyces seonyuensis]
MRIVIESFVDDRDPMLSAWFRFRDAVVAAAPVGTTPGGTRPDRAAAAESRPFPAQEAAAVSGAVAATAVQRPGRGARSREADDADPLPTVWRLLAPNNRELARSVDCAPTPGAARAALADVRARVGELELAVVVGLRGDRNGWLLVLDSAPMLCCSRWYGAGSSNLDAATAARAALEVAVVEPRVHVLSDSRRRVGAAPRR